ncbi:MAG: DNA translocase FtsK 4TM domain-containing protein [Planctomycetota bacterium]
MSRATKKSAANDAKRPEGIPIDLGPRGREFLGILIVGVALYLLVSLATFDRSQLDAESIPRGGMRNLGGVVGYHFANGLTWLLGAGSWALCAAAIVGGFAVFTGRRIERVGLKLTGLFVFVLMLAILLAGPRGDALPTRLFPHGPGGAIAAALSPRLTHSLGGSGRLLVVLFGALVSLLLATEWLLSALLLRLGERVESTARRVGSIRPRLAWANENSAREDEAAEPTAVLDAPRGRGRRAGLAKSSQSGEAAADESVSRSGDADDEAASLAEAPTRRRRGRARVEVEAATGEALELDAESIEDAVENADEDDAPLAAPNERRGASAAEAAAKDAVPADEDAVDAAVAPEPAVVEAAKSADAALRINRRRASRTRPKPRRPHPELPFDEPWNYPPLELFREPPEPEQDIGDHVLEQNKEAIERRLASFKLDARVVAVSVGPAVTQYELELSEGIKLSKVVAYEPDLAAALRALNVRVVAPIPGKDTVGVEVPNKKRQMVYMRELLNDYGLAEDRAIPLFLGKDVAGAAIVEDLARMPHLLIAGTTGSGKSVCINSILLSILMTRTPRQVRLVLIDPKMVELQVFRQVPHLACDVVTNMKRAPQVLDWAVQEMERRYTLLSEVGTNHIKSFNKLGREEVERRLQRPAEAADTHLPYIVVVIDELADLMNVAQKEVEESIQRLAQKSRAVGIHVILATQRPSTDVITGIIKANLPCQVAFKVNRKIDSRVILDSNGAEKLLGHGDMLFVSPTAGQMVRAQGAFVSEEETHGVCSWLQQNGPDQSFIHSLVQTETAKKKGLSERDDLYDKAAEIILGQQRGSATLIQRALAVGYTRATRLLEMMEEDGLVGPFLGSRSREVLMTVEEWRAREAAAAEMEDEFDEDSEDGLDWDDEDASAEEADEADADEELDEELDEDSDLDAEDDASDEDADEDTDEDIDEETDEETDEDTEEELDEEDDEDSADEDDEDAEDAEDEDSDAEDADSDERG